MNEERSTPPAPAADAPVGCDAVEAPKRVSPLRTSRLTLLVLPALLLTACADKHWTKPGGTYEQFTKDSYECATQHSVGGDLRKDMYRACLQARGYQRVPGGEWEGVRD